MLASSSKKKFRVAIQFCFDGLFHKAVAVALRDQLNAYSGGDIIVTLVHVVVDQDAISESAQSLYTQGYDVIVTVGSRCSLYTKKALDLLGGHPSFSLGVRSPESLGLVQSLARPGGQITGVSAQPLDPLMVVKKLMRIAPFRKRWFMPFTPWGEAGKLVEQVQLIRQYVADHSDVMLHTVSVHSPEDAVLAFQNNEGLFDVGIVLEGCAAERAQGDLAQWCWEKEVVFCGTGLQALGVGAACTIGGDISQYADIAFTMLLAFWREGIPLGSQPVQIFPYERKFIANIDMLRRVNMKEEHIKAFCDDDEIEEVRLWV